jgi:hypothetical protein
MWGQNHVYGLDAKLLPFARNESIKISRVQRRQWAYLFPLVDVGTSRQQELAAVGVALFGCNVDGRLKSLGMRDIRFKHRSSEKDEIVTVRN